MKVSIKGLPSKKAVKVEGWETVEKSRTAYDVDMITYVEFWDSHGEYVPWSSPKQIFGKSRLEIVKEESRYNGNTYEEWCWEVNGKRKRGDVNHYRIRDGKALLNVCVGRG